MREAANFAINPEVFNEVFARLGKIEGAANNLRGALFEFIAAEAARQTISSQISMNTIIKDESGEKAEVDVIAEKAHQSVYFIECKGYQPYGTIPDTYVERWLQKLPLIYKHTRSHSVWKNLEVKFEFWTTGKLSPESILMIQKVQSGVRKYGVNYRDAAAFQALVRETRDTGLLKTVEQHFLSHPMAEAKAAVDKRMGKLSRLKDEVSLEDPWDDEFGEIGG